MWPGVPGKEAKGEKLRKALGGRPYQATIYMPTKAPDGVTNLSDFARLEIREPEDDFLVNLQTVSSSHYPAIIEQLRAYIDADNDIYYDPVPLVP